MFSHNFNLKQLSITSACIDECFLQPPELGKTDTARSKKKN